MEKLCTTELLEVQLGGGSKGECNQVHIHCSLDSV